MIPAGIALGDLILGGTMDETLTLLNNAAQSQDWLALGLLALVVVVPVVLKAMGKKIPFVDTAVSAIVAFVKSKKPKEPPPPAKDEKTGLEAVVKVEDKK